MFDIAPLLNNPKELPQDPAKPTDLSPYHMRDIAIGQELAKCPLVLQYLRDEMQSLLIDLSKLVPSMDDDRQTAYAVHTVNAKMVALETLFNMAYKLPEAMQAFSDYKAQQNPVTE